MTTPAVAEVAEETRPSVRIEMVPPVGLDDLWPLVEPMLAPLFEDYPLESIEDVRESIETTHRQLWLILRDSEIVAVAITQIVPFARARVLEVTALVGENVVERLAEIDAWLVDVAREKACSVIQVHGRHGWAKPFKALGGKRAAVVYRKELD